VNRLFNPRTLAPLAFFLVFSLIYSVVLENVAWLDSLPRDLMSWGEHYFLFLITVVIASFFSAFIAGEMMGSRSPIVHLVCALIVQVYLFFTIGDFLSSHIITAIFAFILSLGAAFAGFSFNFHKIEVEPKHLKSPIQIKFDETVKRFKELGLTHADAVKMANENFKDWGIQDKFLGSNDDSQSTVVVNQFVDFKRKIFGINPIHWFWILIPLSFSPSYFWGVNFVHSLLRFASLWWSSEDFLIRIASLITIIPVISWGLVAYLVYSVLANKIFDEKSVAFRFFAVVSIYAVGSGLAYLIQKICYSIIEKYLL
jgi:hypothetical protein